MLIKEKINLEGPDIRAHGPITIVAFGDSVTHGCFEEGDIDYDSVYWNKLRQKINKKRNYVPVNVINAGIGGITAKHSLQRLDKQVLKHNPDLVIVCFGLNDVNGELDEYIASLREIFTKILNTGSEVIFMSPNMMNTYVAEDTLPHLKEYAQITANYQNCGKLELFVENAKILAKELGVLVCDCYADWKELSKTTDITQLLCNRINHPTKEMHELFANRLMQTIFDDENISTETISTMFQNK